MATTMHVPQRIHDGKYFPSMTPDYSYILGRKAQAPRGLFMEPVRRSRLPSPPPARCDCHCHYECDCEQHNCNCTRCLEARGHHDCYQQCDQCGENCRPLRRPRRRRLKPRSQSEVPPLRLEEEVKPEQREAETQTLPPQPPPPPPPREPPIDAPPILYKVLKPLKEERPKRMEKPRRKALTPDVLDRYQTIADASCPCCAEVNQINVKRHNHGPQVQYPWYAGADKNSRKALMPTEMPMRLYGNPYKPFDGTVDMDQLYSYLKPTYFDMADKRDGTQFGNPPDKWHDNILAANDMFNTGLNKLRKTATNKW